MNKWIVTALSITFVTACSHQHIGNMKLKEQSLTTIEGKIVPNQTTKQDVRSYLGEPDKVTVSHGIQDEIWFYQSYDQQKNYTPTVMLPITLPLSILFNRNLMSPIETKQNEKQLRIKIDTQTNKVTNVSTAIDNKEWY